MTILTVGILVSGRTLLAQTSTEQLTVPLSNPGKAYTLDVSLLSGSIRVTSHAGKDILIDVTVKNNKDDDDGDGNSNGMKRLSKAHGYEIVANENNNVVTVRNQSHERTINLALKIPQDVKLKLHTVNNGVIEVDNVRGELEINNVNGEIKTTNISGSVVASTVNGNVTTTFNATTIGTPMAFSTLNGNVDVTFPAATKSNFKLKSDRGEVYSDFDMEIDKTQPKVIRTDESGMHKLKLDDWVYGKVNGGGAEVLMKNMNGNIYVRKAK